MTHLILIRHGETDWNVEGRWQGQADVPLNARGREQARQLIDKLDDTHLDAIYASDLVRAWETAKGLARSKGLDIIPEPRLREIHQGEWQGLLVTEIEERYADRFHQRHHNPLDVAPPGGETVNQVRTRVLAAFEDILNAHPRQTVAVVAHGFVLAVALAHFQGRPIDEVWTLIPDNGKPIPIEVS